jgi:hypothetical protein
MNKITALTLGLAIGFSVVPAAYAKKTNLKGAEISQVLKGKFAYSGKSSGTTTYSGNKIVTIDKKHGKLTGTWRVKGNKYCRTWLTPKKGREKCSTIKQDETGRIFNGPWSMIKQ